MSGGNELIDRLNRPEFERLQHFRSRSHEQEIQTFFNLGATMWCSQGARTPSRVPLTLGHHGVHCAEVRQSPANPDRAMLPANESTYCFAPKPSGMPFDHPKSQPSCSPICMSLSRQGLAPDESSRHQGGALYARVAHRKMHGLCGRRGCPAHHGLADQLFKFGESRLTNQYSTFLQNSIH